MSTIPDHLIDKAARAFQRLTWRGPLPAWEDTPSYIRDALRDDASAILDAVADDLRSEAWDEGALTAWSVSTTEVNGQRYHWRRSGEPRNPYKSCGHPNHGGVNHDCLPFETGDSYEHR